LLRPASTAALSPFPIVTKSSLLSANHGFSLAVARVSSFESGCSGFFTRQKNVDRVFLGSYQK
jgi:hypothetical protein